jgi:gliding motility-associated-like protein
MKKLYTSLTLFILLFVVNKAVAQAPNWAVNINDYSNSMTITGAVNIDYQESQNGNDIVGAFVNGICRGVGKPTYVASLDRYIVYLLVYGDVADDEVKFQVYHEDGDEIRIIENSLLYRVNGIVGSSVSPYVWSNPALSNEANILTFDFGIPLTTTAIIGDSIFVEVPYLTDTSSLSAVYTTSSYAFVKVTEENQISGVTINNFSGIVQYHIQSADETAVKTYFVKTSVTDASPTDLFLSNATLLETASSETLIGSVIIEDPDNNGINVVALTTNLSTDNDRFQLTGTSLASNSTFDFEDQQIFTIELVVINALGVEFIKSFDISLIDENDETPYIVQDTVYLDEDFELATLVHQIEVLDRDSSAEFKEHSFLLLVGNEGARFSLNKESGDIYLVNPLDYEAKTLTYELEFEVSDGDFTSEGSIIIIINDVNDGIPVIDNAEIDVLESTNKGDNIFQVIASDTDVNAELHYSITSGNTGDVFEIDELKGLITLKDTLDYETTTKYILELTVSDTLNSTIGFVTVNIIDVNDEFPVVKTDTVEVLESTFLGQIAYTVKTSDSDANSKLQYTITDGNLGSAFTIDPAFGIITILQPLDYETIEKYFLEVTVDDGSQKSLALIQIDVINVNDEVPIVSDDELTISESLIVGNAITMVEANDIDSLVNLTYQITGGNIGNAFVIDEQTGEIKLASIIDFETLRKYQLDVTVSDGVDEANGTIEINISNENDELPVLVETTVTVVEDFALNVVFDTLVATDIDTLNALQYFIKSGNDELKFEVDEATGHVKLLDRLDYETTTSYRLGIDVFDGGNTITGVLNITVLDVADQSPTDLYLSDSSLTETSLEGTIVAEVEVIDADSTGLYQVNLTSNLATDNDKFRVEGTKLVNDTILDYEEQQLYTIEIVVKDEFEIEVIKQFTIYLVNENDETPQIINDTIYVDENFELTKLVYQIQTTDRDSSAVFRQTKFLLLSGNEALRFSLDKETGEVYLVNPLDFESSTVTYDLAFEVNDGSSTSERNILILVKDVNDRIPEVMSDNTYVLESSEKGDEVHQVIASDVDAGAELHYAITSGNIGTAFAINDTTGLITLNDTLDYETTEKYLLEVTVSDTLHTAVGYITINVVDLNDEYPIVLWDTAQVSESAIVNQIAYILETYDSDANTRLRFTFSNGNIGPAFTIDPAFGIITILQKIDFETLEKYYLEVTVEDGIQKTIAFIVIELVNENDEIPIVTSDTIAISESYPQDKSVISILAEDVDNLTALTYSISGGNTNNVFSINQNTGEIKLDSILDFETKSSYELEITVSDEVDQSTGVVQVNLVNENDELPVMDTLTVLVQEDESLREIVATLQATDPDELNPLQYTITGGNDELRFELDPLTGEITLVNPLDFETTTNYNLVIDVFDGLHTITSALKVQVVNTNDEPPSVEDLEVYVYEDAVTKFLIDTIKATDPDGGSAFFFSIPEEEMISNFLVNASNGKMTVLVPLDYENDTIYEFQVTVYDGVKEAYGDVTVHVLDVNDNAPVLALDSFYTDEGLEVGTVIHQVVGTDVDQNPEIHYFYTGFYSNLFAIDSVTGQISIKEELDFESEERYQFKVTLNDGVFTSEGDVIIVVNDLNDEIPMVIDTTFAVSEYEIEGYQLGQIYAGDKDVDSYLSFELLSQEKHFELSDDGQLSLLSILDYESASKHDLLVQVSDGINSSTDTITVTVIDENEKIMDADNTFSPNGDEVNDHWQIRNTEVYNDCSFVIYNHLGHEVFESIGYSEPWDGMMDGKELPIGTYYYLVKCDNCEGCLHRGYISLIR